MAALILPLISNKNGAVYDSTVGVISRLLQSDVAKVASTELLVPRLGLFAQLLELSASQRENHPEINSLSLCISKPSERLV
jgi:hypothetical protein